VPNSRNPHEAYRDIIDADTSCEIVRVIEALDRFARRGDRLDPGAASAGWHRLREMARLGSGKTCARPVFRGVPRNPTGKVVAIAAFIAAAATCASLSGALARVLGTSSAVLRSPVLRISGPRYAPSCPYPYARLWGLGSGIGSNFVELNVQNTGKDIPHFVLQINSFGSWEYKGLTVSIQQSRSSPETSVTPRLLSSRGSLHVWDFGRLPTCAILYAHVDTRVSGAGGMRDMIKVYSNLAAHGQVDPGSAIMTGADNLR